MNTTYTYHIMRSHAGGAGRLDVSMCPCVHAALQAARPSQPPVHGSLIYLQARHSTQPQPRAAQSHRHPHRAGAGIAAPPSTPHTAPRGPRHGRLQLQPCSSAASSDSRQRRESNIKHQTGNRKQQKQPEPHKTNHTNMTNHKLGHKTWTRSST